MSTWQAFRWTLGSLFADKGAVVPAVGGVVFYFLFYPLPYLPQAVRDVPVVVADYDASPLSRQLARELDATETLHVLGVSRRVANALPQLQRGDIGGIVVVPPNFHRDVLRGTPTGVTVMANGGYLVLDGAVLQTTAAVVGALAAPAYAAQLVRAQLPPAAVRRVARAGPAFIKQPLFNIVQGYASYVIPASMGLIVHQLLIIAICMLIGTWVEGGRWPIASAGRLSFGAFAGMLGALALVVYAALMFWIGFVFWYHDLPRAANLSGAIAFAVLYALAVAGLGIALGCWLGERERALQIIGGISIPLLFLSGFAFAVESIGAPLVLLSHLLPTTPGIQGFIKLNEMGATWREAWPQFANLLLLAVLYVAAAWWAASRRAIGSQGAPVSRLANPKNSAPASRRSLTRADTNV